MPILYDCHLHTSFSGDSDEPMENQINAALSKGLKGICMTEHLDYDYPVSPECPPGFFDLDIPAYRTQYLQSAQKYASRLRLSFGIELGLQPHLAEKHAALISKWPFDFVLGSAHTCHGQDPYYPAFYEGRSEEEAYREYFTCIPENLEVYDNFDSFAHLDYVVRYGPNKDAYYCYDKYADVLDPILFKLISMGKALECNTGGIRYKLKSLNPSEEVLRRYKKLGGELVTVGSDAHTADRVGDGFAAAEVLLKACGFRYYATFTERKPVMHKL